MSPFTLVLFDIDGTLLDVRGAGRRAFAQAIDPVFGWKDDCAYVRFAGSTDLDILRQIAERHGHRLTRADSDRFFERLIVELERNMAGAELTIYPGVRELLAALSDNEDVILGLLTGNIEAGARIKLKHFDLHGHFVLGAFGHEHGDRREIARLANERADRHAGPRRIAARFVIGDTPNDILAARAIGAKCIAVATGRFTTQNLLDAGADFAVENLADTRRVLGFMAIGN
jgi:phosphoglycolate phosphatase-like HAD superfamily hydrolase